MRLGHLYVYNAGISCLVNEQHESQSIIVYCIRKNYNGVNEFHMYTHNMRHSLEVRNENCADKRKFAI